MIIECKKIAEEIYKECGSIDRKKETYIALCSSGKTAQAESFIRQKKLAAERLGIELREYEFSIKKLEEISSDKKCGGIVVQLPLESVEMTERAVRMLPEDKDVDNLSGRAAVPAPAVAVIEAVLEHVKPELKNMRPPTEIAIIGQGKLVGKPAYQWATHAGAEAVRVHDMGFDPASLLSADLVISGAGAGHIFNASHVRKGAVVIDFGYALDENGKMAGDFDPAGAETRGILYTPTPGGTGPVLVACLMRNFCKLNEIKAGGE